MKLPPDLEHLLKRADAAYQAASNATTKRERNKQEANYYSTCESIYWVLKSIAE